MPGITKEVKNLFAGTLTKITFDEAKQMERQGLVKILLSKGVFTIKRGDVLRRRFRLMICGNFAPKPGEDEAMSLYAGGASAELPLMSREPSCWLHGPLVWRSMLFTLRDSSSRRATRKTAKHGWCRGLCMGFVRRGTKITFGGDFIILQPSLVDPELWLVYNVNCETQEKGNLIGLIITYVDDLFYLSTPEVIETLHKWVEAEWPCWALEWANSEDGTRYLGMTVKQDADGSFVISQEGYILDVVRSYSMENAIGAKLPCPKEWLVEEELNPDNDENFSEEELKSAQRIVGEQLWLAMRTRPDILYVLNFMSSRVSRQPLEVLSVGRRVLAYLQTTSNLAMKIESRPNASSSSNTRKKPLTSNGNDSRRNTSSSSNTLGKPPARSSRNVVYHAHARPELIGSDASYAPYGGRSFGVAVITVDGFPVSWKASKQSFVTLSVMESELYEAFQTTLLLEHVGVLLDELCEVPVPGGPVISRCGARMFASKLYLGLWRYSTSKGPYNWRIWPRRCIRRQGCWSSFVSGAFKGRACVNARRNNLRLLV